MSFNISIDGPAGAGKSTIARAAARSLGFLYVYTGAMYRAIALYLLRNNADVNNDNELERFLDQITIRIAYSNGEQQIILNNENVYREFVYYLEHHELMAQYEVAGYSMIDLFVCQMDQYNIVHDVGKNDGKCNKEKMVLQAFDVMLKMSENPDEIVKKLQSGEGMDKM